MNSGSANEPNLKYKISKKRKSKINNLELSQKSLNNNLIILHEIKNLKPNWNENGADAFSDNLIDKVKDIINKLKLQPQIFPTGRNSIQLEFENENNYLEFEIFEDRTIMYYENGNISEEINVEIEKINELIDLYYAE